MVEVGRDLWRLSCTTPLLKQGYLEPVAQDHVQTAFEYLQGGRLHNLSGQPFPVLSHPHSQKVFPDVQTEPPVFHFVPTASCPAKQSRLSPPLLICEVLQSLNHFHGPSLDSLQYVHVSLVLRSPELDTGLQDTCPWFHCLCISFLHFSFTRRSLLSQAGLLPSLPDFLHMGIERSSALRKMSLKSCQLCSAPLSLRAVSQEGPDSTLHLARSSQGCEFHQGMITAAQAATSLDLSN
ncbi:hypothetical protein QYF61_005612 [Mycteria americana]|uniref:Uncharacterized protein n=1 Tax=Mycteria americana TaxID=33587 RepID=A0AAN7MLV3_MYCAM|nr:hypothetical protein QYF61_005612 [Mycteria americana]